MDGFDRLSLDRRTWLARTTSLFAAGPLACALPTLASAGNDPRGVSLFEPSPSARSAKGIKFSLAAYSYRDLLTGASPALTLDDFVDDCAKFGLQGTELTSYYFPSDVDDAYLVKLRSRCFRSGLDVSGTAVGNDFGFAEGSARQAEIESVHRWIDRALLLGAPVIRIFAGHAKPGDTPEKTHQAIVSAIRECCEYAGSRGIHLALENHGGPTATPDGLLAIAREIDSPWFGINLDTGNFHGDDVYAELAQVADRAINVQVKVAITPSSGVKEPTDYRRLADLLGQANYRGYVVLEYEENEEPRGACERHLESLRDAFDR